MLKAEAGGTPINGKDCVDIMGQCKGDFDCDADVDGKDTDKMKKNFGWDQDDSSCDEKGICAGDLDKDGDIDSTDINAFKKVFGNSPKKDSPCGYEECAGDFDCDTDVDGRMPKSSRGTLAEAPSNNPVTRENYARVILMMIRTVMERMQPNSRKILVEAGSKIRAKAVWCSSKSETA